METFFGAFSALRLQWGQGGKHEKGRLYFRRPFLFRTQRESSHFGHELQSSYPRRGIAERPLKQREDREELRFPTILPGWFQPPVWLKRDSLIFDSSIKKQTISAGLFARRTQKTELWGGALRLFSGRANMPCGNFNLKRNESPMNLSKLIVLLTALFPLGVFAAGVPENFEAAAQAQIYVERTLELSRNKGLSVGLAVCDMDSGELAEVVENTVYCVLIFANTVNDSKIALEFFPSGETVKGVYVWTILGGEPKPFPRMSAGH